MISKRKIFACAEKRNSNFKNYIIKGTFPTKTMRKTPEDGVTGATPKTAENKKRLGNLDVKESKFQLAGSVAHVVLV